MTTPKSKLFAAVHEYVVAAYPAGVDPELPPLHIGTTYFAGQKLLAAIMEYALTELEAALAKGREQ